MTRTRLMLLAAILALSPGSARAGDDVPGISFFYPIITRRPVIERELELTVTHEKGRDGRATEAAAAIEWPILPRWQVELKVPLIFLQPREATLTDGQIEAISDRIVEAVEKATDAELRR